jgi:hypothetical protein
LISGAWTSGADFFSADFAARPDFFAALRGFAARRAGFFDAIFLAFLTGFLPDFLTAFLAVFFAAFFAAFLAAFFAAFLPFFFAALRFEAMTLLLGAN